MVGAFSLASPANSCWFPASFRGKMHAFPPGRGAAGGRPVSCTQVRFSIFRSLAWMHRAPRRNLRIHNLFRARIAIRGFSPCTRFVGSCFLGCWLTTLRCILPTSSEVQPWLQSDARKFRAAGPVECISGPFPSDPEIRNELSRGRIVVAILLLVPLPAIAKSQTHAHGHDSEGRSHQDFDGPAQGHLPIFGSCCGCAVAHGAALGERGDRPQAQKRKQQGSATPARMPLCRLYSALHRSLHRRSHLTPNERIRSASGKKTIIMARQNTSAHMVSHFIRDNSYFMCMK